MITVAGYMKIDIGVALPAETPYEYVKVWRPQSPDNSIVAKVVDKGPWNINDPLLV